jgi:peptidoglycan/xylan/chitin deacetylase (PgdA/CDA1 family)
VEGSSPEGWSLVTLDDGYKDTLEVVLPLLERYQAPAIVFATVGFVAGEREPFSAWVARMMCSCREFVVDGRRYDLKKNFEFEEAWRHAYRGMERGSAQRRNRRLECLAYENGCALPEPCDCVYMDWKQLREISRHPLIEIGGHSWTHPRLSRVAPWALWVELHSARRRLEEKLDVPIKALAYPHGAHNILVRNMARVAGYRFAFTTAEKPVKAGRRMNPLAIPRLTLATQE